MELTKTEYVDNITVDQYGSVFVRKTITVKEGDTVISNTYYRTSFYPGQDISGQPENVVAIANVVWTPEVIAAYETAQSAREAEQAARLESLNTQASE